MTWIKMKFILQYFVYDIVTFFIKKKLHYKIVLQNNIKKGVQSYIKILWQELQFM